MDPSFWQYCEIPLCIYGFSLNKQLTTTTTRHHHHQQQLWIKKNIPIAETLFKLVIKVVIQLCKNAFLWFFFSDPVLCWILITKSTFLHHVGLKYSLLHWGRTLTRWLKKYSKTRITLAKACYVLGQVWYLIVSIPNICPLSYLKTSVLLLNTYNM